jgi:hypothetical protein
MRTYRPLLALLACAVLGAATSGCFIITDDGGSGPPAPSATPDQISIDTGATLSVTPGQGAGLFVEYLGGGAWDVFTACDTAITNRPCDFDVIITVGQGVGIQDPKLHDAEPVDSLALISSGFQVKTGTALKLDGVTFSTDPGASIKVDMLLDGEARPPFINWVSGGEHVSGTSDTTNPVEFVPTLP